MALPCFFASDLHGSESRYRTLWERIAAERPAAVFLGGDLLPGSVGLKEIGPFVRTVIEGGVRALGLSRPKIFIVPGNDDAAADFAQLSHGEADGLWTVLHMRSSTLADVVVAGYGCVPPTPFGLKDWERYDVSRFVDPGCLSPEEGQRTVVVDADDIRYGTISKDIAAIAGVSDRVPSVWLFHSPPYQTDLDRAELDGRFFDYVPLDVNVGSIAVRRFIEDQQPLLTMHGHVHESARLTGSWRQRLGSTWMLSAAHDGPELALVRFDLEHLDTASRELI